MEAVVADRCSWIAVNGHTVAVQYVVPFKYVVDYRGNAAGVMIHPTARSRAQIVLCICVAVEGVVGDARRAGIVGPGSAAASIAVYRGGIERNDIALYHLPRREVDPSPPTQSVQTRYIVRYDVLVHFVVVAAGADDSAPLSIAIVIVGMF
jgi:hypothetical protein